MSDSFYARITPIGDGGDEHPAHPIAPGGPGSPSHPIAPTPSHPIVIRPPGAPVTIWPPGIDNSLPPPPPGIWGGAPTHPDQGLPPLPPSISNDLPVFGSPEHPIAAPPGTIWPPLPVQPPAGDSKVLVIVWVPGAGYRYAVIDLSLTVGGGPALTPEPR
jgi:hypothetical protein